MNLTTEEQQMLQAIRLGLAPYPTPGNFRLLWSLVEKGALQVAPPEEELPMSGGEMLQSIREETDEHIPSLAEMIDLG